MQKIYVLKYPEEDETTLDAMIAQGLDVDEGWVENPKCPHCGSETLLAYDDDGDFYVCTWEALDEQELQIPGNQWYLVCSNFLCGYQEGVERLKEPAGAELFFDMEASSQNFEETCCLYDNHAENLESLIDYFRGLLEERPENRKIRSLLLQARAQLESTLNDLHEWLRKVPGGRRIEFYFQGDQMKATFVTATEDTLLVLTRPKGEMMAISAKSISRWWPIEFSPEPPEELEIDLKKLNTNRIIMCCGFQEMVVVRGHHLQLTLIDRLGQYHVGSSEEATAHILGLQKRGENWWEGHFRRSEIEARYDLRDMVKVQGVWLEVCGESYHGHLPDVHTQDPEVAAKLGLEPQHAWEPSSLPKEQRPILYWGGFIPREMIQEKRQVPTYHWPIPERQESVG